MLRLGIVMSPQHWSGLSPICPAMVIADASSAITHPTDLHFTGPESALSSSRDVQPPPLRESSHSTRTICIYARLRVDVLRARSADAATRRTLEVLPIRNWLPASR